MEIKRSNASFAHTQGLTIGLCTPSLRLPVSLSRCVSVSPSRALLSLCLSIAVCLSLCLSFSLSLSLCLCLCLCVALSHIRTHTHTHTRTRTHTHTRARGFTLPWQEELTPAQAVAIEEVLEKHDIKATHTSSGDSKFELLSFEMHGMAASCLDDLNALLPADKRVAVPPS